MSYISDDDCIKRILTGESRAFSHLVEQHQTMVFTIIFRITEQREAAEDIAQEVFLKVYQSLNTFKGASKFSTWLYSIAYNMAISYVRKSKPTFVPLIENEIEIKDDAEEHIDFNDVSGDTCSFSVLSKALNGLKQDELLLINMYYTQKMSIEEISEITNLSQSNVKVKLFRIRKKLADQMTLQLKKSNIL